MSDPALTISVIVPCYNDSARVARCIESLLAQTHRAHEIIIVNDCSTDNTAQVAAKFPVRVVNRETNGGAAAARASGAKLATGEILAFIDADCAAPTDWLAKIAAAFSADQTLGGYGGRYAHPPQQTLGGQLGALEEEYAHQIFTQHPTDALPPGGNCAFRRDVWNNGRTWRELYFFKGMGSGEDSVAGHEIKQRARVVFSPDLFVDHHQREAGYFRRHLNRGYSRSAIVARRLTNKEESRLALAAYGGWRLFIGSLLLGMALLALPVLAWFPQPAAIAAASALVLHLALTHRFFSFARRYNQTLPAEHRAGIFTRALYRFMLLLRSCCWILGAFKGWRRYAAFRVGQTWNVCCSILHFWRPGRISKLFYFVTSKCNARCAFCFNLDNVVNWQARKPHELTLEEVRKVARGFGRLPYLTLSGGEPFVRQDLPEVIEAFYKLAKTQWVTIPTNAALTERTIEATLEMLNRCPGLFLTIQVSLDSMYEDHDKSRVIKGGFEKMAETLKQLAEIRREYPHLRVQIATCYDTFNLHRIDEIIEYCRKHFEYDQQMFYLIRDARTLITENNNHLVRPYIELLQKNEEHEWRAHRGGLWHRAVRTLQGLVYRDIVRIKLEQKFLRPCAATQKFATLWDDGQISPCEILEKQPLGNIRDFDFDFYKLKAAQRVNDWHKKEIVEKKCNCDWMCATPINMLYDVKVYSDLLRGFLAPGKLLQKQPLPPQSTPAPK